MQVVRTKNLPGEEVSTPYTSITEIRTGESTRPHPRYLPERSHSFALTARAGLWLDLAVPEDINWFLADSEQKEGALAAGVFVLV
jgi:molecular chaperone Hsp33